MLFSFFLSFGFFKFFFFFYRASRHGALLLSGTALTPTSSSYHLSEEIWNKGDPFSTCSGFQWVRGVPIYSVPSHWHQEDFHYMPLQGGRLRMCTGYSFQRYVQNGFYKRQVISGKHPSSFSKLGINHAFVFFPLTVNA